MNTPAWKEGPPVPKTIVVDSRQRDCVRYKSPAFYTLNLENLFKDVSSIELLQHLLLHLPEQLPINHVKSLDCCCRIIK